MADPLIGKFFSSYGTKAGVRELIWNGQVRSRVKEGLYLVKLVNALTLVAAGIVSFNKQIMVPLEDMKDWEFFDSREAWSESYAAYAQHADQRLRREATQEGPHHAADQQ